MLQLANILYSKGFSITLVHTEFNSPNSRKYPHFDFHSFSDGVSEIEAPTEDLPAFLAALNAKCLVPFRDCLVKLLMSNTQEEDSFACLITDSIWHFANAVANDFKLRTLVLQSSSISAHLAFAAYPILREKGYLPIQDSQLEAPVIELPPLRVKDIPRFKSKDPENVHKMLSAIDSQLQASSGMIWNSFQDLENVQLTTIPEQYYNSISEFPVGPFHKYFPASSSSLWSQDQSSISWLEKQAPNSVIYVSFVSVAAISETEFLEIAWGLANSMVLFLWVIRPGLVRGAEWLEPLPKGFLKKVDRRGYIVKWAPQQEVLAHPAVGGFWTHSGWNSTLESICEGVPMICQPFLSDQMVNARYVSHVWRIGLHLRGEATEGQEMRERVLQLKEKVDVCLKKGGSSYQFLQRLVDHILSFT
ncbi:hypothetical protein WN944_006032 [Citrus x changshan-huyou]|uniref:Uncharacterized protein n=1 Tax=Citrus x changshan-huyou TaxID=2935761 RepID=A0AAP0MIF9_9ROSI